MQMFRKTAAALCAALSVSAAVSAAPLPAERQIEILAETAEGQSGWFVGPGQGADWQSWYYTVTDLDRDGKLEIFKAKNGWANSPAVIVCEELSEDGESRTGEISLVAGTKLPSLLTGDSLGQSVVLTDETNNLYHYIVSERLYNNEFEWTDTKYALTFSGTTLEIESLACVACQLSGRDGTITRQAYLPYWHTPDLKGGEPVPILTQKKIDESRYLAMEGERFPGCTSRDLTFYWYSAEVLKDAAAQGSLNRALESAYAAFRR